MSKQDTIQLLLFCKCMYWSINYHTIQNNEQLIYLYLYISDINIHNEYFLCIIIVDLEKCIE